MYLIDMLRPRLFVELGTHNGVSYCGFCQAVRELRTDTRCYAIDTWEGDAQAGYYGPEVLAELRSYHDSLYSGFSRLVESTFDDALDHFQDGSVDLLHLDGYHVYEAAKKDLENWLPKLSDRGVVLIHDTNVRERDFGTWRLLEELKPRYPHFEFLHGYGLAVLAVGSTPPAELAPLLSGSNDPTCIRDFFYRLGQGVSEQYRLKCLESDLVRTRAEHEASSELLSAQAAEHASQVLERDRQIQHLSEKLDERAAYVSELEGEMQKQATLITELHQVAQDNQRLEAELHAARLDEETVRHQLTGIQSRLSFRFLHKLWSTQMRVAPPGTIRGKVWMGSTRLARRSLGRSASTSGPARGRTTTHEPQPQDPVGLEPHTREFYESWVRACEEVRYDSMRVDRLLERLQYKPTISIVMPVYNTPREYLGKAIDSVLHQFYPHWELCICDDASKAPHVREMLNMYASLDNRIKVTFSGLNGGIAAASNSALELATGDYVGLLDHDDELTPDALSEVVSALQNTNADLVYSDEDKLNTAGQRCDPFFKPSWSPDLLLSCMYTGHFSVYRKAILDLVGGFRQGFDGSQDHDLALRCTEVASQIVHIPKVLYHWRIVPGSAAGSTEAKPYAYEAAERALADAVRRRGIEGEVLPEPVKGFYRVKRAIDGTARISIIIPTRDRVDLLRRCLKSIELMTSFPNYEVIIVDNGSREAATRAFLEATRHRVIRDDGPFNYSRLNNRAVREATGEYVVFLNNDTEVLSPDWLSAMLEHAQRPEVGAVGAKLLYPENTIQHAGIVLGLGGVAGNAHTHVEGYRGTGYYNFPNIVRECSAVTAACLMVRRDVFHEVGGFDEDNLPVAYNDVDLCLRLRRHGYLVLYTPHALLRHHECATREAGIDAKETAYIVDSWKSELLGDQYYNPNLTTTRRDFTVDPSRLDTMSCVEFQAAASDVVGPLEERRLIGQEFSVDQDRLCAIAVKTGTYFDQWRGTITLRLRDVDEPSRDIAIASLDGSSVRDNEYCCFRFQPLEGSAGKRFCFYVQVSSQKRGEVTLWKTTVPNGAGFYLDNNRRQVGMLTFKAYCDQQYYRCSSTENLYSGTTITEPNQALADGTPA